MDANYFTCTLGQAAALGIRQPHHTANNLVDALAEEHPNLPAVGFPRPGKEPDHHWTDLVFTFNDIKTGRDNAAAKLLKDGKRTLSARQTVGLLCPSTPEFLFTWLALMRLGHSVLLIAPQCQPGAIASLCKTCAVTILYCDEVYREQANEAVRLSTEESDALLEVACLPFAGDDLQKTAFVRPESDGLALPIVEVDENDTAYLHHTSGTSSGMPKPIPQTHRAGVGVLPSFTDGHTAATFTTTPLYHGGIADLFRAWTSKSLIWLFPGKKVPITATNIIKCLHLASDEHVKRKLPAVKYFSSVPYVLQMMEADHRGLQYLQDMAIVGVGGAALPAEVGDRLVEQGVNLISRFGSAECGFLMSSHREYGKDKDWQYLRVAPGVEKYVGFESQADGELSELVVLAGWPHMAKRNREDGSFATADLFAPHSSTPGAWRYHSRADSQLTLITGKKFDPAPLEASIATSDLLDDVLIFGNGRPYPGALLFKSQQSKGLTDRELRGRIWPAMEKLNGESQDHARIPRHMLVSMNLLSKPLEKSSKGTLLRGAVEKRFQQEIEDAYDQMDNDSTATDVTDEQLPAVVRNIVQSVVNKGAMLEDTTDLFSYGVDSVAGMQIRGKLRRLLPQSANQLPINVVEDCGNAVKLAEFVRRRRHGEADTNAGAATSEHRYMEELVEEYSRFINVPATDALANGSTREDAGEVVVLTGATGALGAHVLDQYRKSKSVKKIYCLVRGADEHAASERVSKALAQRHLQSLSSDNSDGKVVVLQAALGEARLGLDKGIYDRVAKQATVIMHVAWSVNFRMKLRSFVKDNIAGVTNLINLALASPRSKPPAFGLCSSVASVMAYQGRSVPEEPTDDPSTATELGYSQSKWVAERICQRANDTTKMKDRISVFRVGQLAGDTINGVWNTKEAWPMMLSAVKVTQSLPELDDKLDWLPVDIAASALIQGVDASASERGLTVYHVVNDNDRPTWSDLLTWMQRHEKFDVVSPRHWVRQLESAIDSGSQHPSGQLLDHWKQAYCRDREDDGESGPASFAMERTKAALPALRNVEPVDEKYFGKLWAWIQESV